MNLILCDLNMTLSSNMRQVFARVSASKTYGESIKQVEVYRPELVEWLQQAQQAGWAVELFTVRKAEWREDTLRNVEARTGFVPDGSWFNDTGISGKYAAKVKRQLLERAVLHHRPDRLFALESNPSTRAMFNRHKVANQPYQGPESLPEVEALDDVAGAAPVFE